MSHFDLNSLYSSLPASGRQNNGIDLTEKYFRMETGNDVQPIVNAINGCPDLQYLTLTGNTLGVLAVEVISRALEHHPELKVLRFSDISTGRMQNEILSALVALVEGMTTAGARLSVLHVGDNSFGPIGLRGLAILLRSDVCRELEELRLNNIGLGITGGRLIARALASRPLKLKTFIAGQNVLGDDGAIAFAKVFQDMGTLVELAMPHNEITHIGISAITEALKHNVEIATINLNGNPLGIRGAQVIAAALPNLKTLKSVNLANCLLKGGGASALEKVLKEHSLVLECLELSYNEVGRDAGVEARDLMPALPHSCGNISRPVLAGAEEVYRFLGQPTFNNLNRLGANAAGVIDVHLQTIQDPKLLIEAFVDATFCVAGLSEQYPRAAEIADEMFPILIMRAGQQFASAWTLADKMLAALGLVKAEDQHLQNRWPLGPCYTSLSRVIDAPYFPKTLRDTIRCFANSKKSSMPYAAKLCP